MGNAQVKDDLKKALNKADFRDKAKAQKKELLAKVFQKFDTDGSGELDKEEACVFIREVFDLIQENEEKLYAPKGQLAFMYNESEMRHKMAAFASEIAFLKGNCERVFEIIDLDESGNIDLEEFESFLEVILKYYVSFSTFRPRRNDKDMHLDTSQTGPDMPPIRSWDTFLMHAGWFSGLENNPTLKSEAEEAKRAGMDNDLAKMGGAIAEAEAEDPEFIDKAAKEAEIEWNRNQRRKRHQQRNNHISNRTF